MVFGGARRKMKVAVIWIVNCILIILCAVRKRKIKLLPMACLVLFVVFFSLLTPCGKVLFSAGNFRVTLGSIEDGLFKSGVLILFQCASKFLVSANLKLPGKFGAFITGIFFVYEKLTEEDFLSHAKSSIEDKNGGTGSRKISALFERIDERLLSIWKEL